MFEYPFTTAPCRVTENLQKSKSLHSVQSRTLGSTLFDTNT